MYVNTGNDTSGPSLGMDTKFKYLRFRNVKEGSQTGSAYLQCYLHDVTFDVGCVMDEIAVDLEGRNLKITAKKAEPAETKEGENACPDKAKRTGTYSRSFRLNGIRTEDVTASYEDGVLRVDLPKKERPAPEKRSVTIH